MVEKLQFSLLNMGQMLSECKFKYAYNILLNHGQEITVQIAKNMLNHGLSLYLHMLILNILEC